MSNANFSLMLQDVKAPETLEITPVKRPSFGAVEVSDGAVDPMLSSRIIEEPETKAYETMPQPRFNSADDWMKGKKMYEQFAIKSDLRKKPKFNSGC